MITYFVSNDIYDDNGNRIPNKTVSALGNEVISYFQPPIRLGDSGKNYELRVTRASIVYCVPNISSALKNNKLTYSYKIGNLLTTKTYTFSDGLYSIDNINLKLSLFTSDVDNGGDPNLIYFAADESTSRIYVIFSQLNASVDASATDSILISLGFTTTQGSAGDGIIGNFTEVTDFSTSINPANLNPIHNYLVSTNITSGNYLNSNVSNVVDSIPIGRTTAFSTVDFSPTHPVRSSITNTNIDKLVVTLLDNYGKNVDFTGGGTSAPQSWSITLSITENESIL